MAVLQCRTSKVKEQAFQNSGTHKHAFVLFSSPKTPKNLIISTMKKVINMITDVCRRNEAKGAGACLIACSLKPEM